MPSIQKEVSAVLEAISNHDGAECIKATEAMDKALSDKPEALTLAQIAACAMARTLSRFSPGSWNAVATAIVHEAMGVVEDDLGVGQTRH